MFMTVSCSFAAVVQCHFAVCNGTVLTFHLVINSLQPLSLLWSYFDQSMYGIFNIYTSVHRQYILRVQPTRCDSSQSIYFCKTLYMFQTVFLSVIRGSQLHIQHQAFVRPSLLPAGSSNGLKNA